MIELRAIRKSFKSQEVLRGVDLTIPTGEVTVIVGQSGGGKSVLLKHIIGLLMPDSGDVIVDGVNTRSLHGEKMVAFRRKFGMLFQNAALFDSMNVFENVAFPLVEHGGLTQKAIREKVLEKLSLVGLAGVDNKMPSELSGGMRKRAGLARAIALEPEIILYDEPTTGLDPIMADMVDNLILHMQKKLNITSVVISHDMASTLRTGNNIAMLADGRIVEQGSPEKFRASKNELVRRFLE